MNMIYKLFVSKLFLSQSTDSTTDAVVSVVICVQLFSKHDCRGGSFSDAHMSISDEILTPLMAEEDVAVRRRKRRTTLRTGRRDLVVKDTLPKVVPHATKWICFWDHSMELSRTAQYNIDKNSRSKHDDQISPKPLRTGKTSTTPL